MLMPTPTTEAQGAVPLTQCGRGPAGEKRTRMMHCMMMMMDQTPQALGKP